MEIIKIPVGILQANCYIIINNKKALIVDPGDEFEKIDANLKLLGAKLVGILITHNHFDHVGAKDQFVNKYKVPVCDFKNKKKFEDFNFEILETPGHTIDSITFYFKDDAIMFTGDFLFKESIGRTDLETGNYESMIHSLEMIKKYSKNIVIYPGHGDFTTISNEINNNIYLKTSV